jgi:guanylate kinase
LETEGALRLRERVPGAVTVFVRAPSFEENERRLRERATEDESEIEKRLNTARAQLVQADEFDYVIVNDDLDRAVGELEDIVRRELATAGSMSAP